MPTLLRSRLIAASLHFLASLSIFMLLLLIVIKLWYPQPHFSASGGLQGLTIIALVDLVLGPLITLIIYNVTKPKKELVIDLSIIILIQLSALFYGIHTVYTQRPVALAFWESKFYTVSAADFEQQAIAITKLNQFSHHTPALIYAEKPTTVAGLQAMLATTQTQQIPPFAQLGLYRSISSHKQTIFKHSIDINEVIKLNADMAEQLLQLLAETSTQKDDNFYIVLESKYQNIILAFNAEAEQVGFLKAPYK